jgi:hypothetical protein
VKLTRIIPLGALVACAIAAQAQPVTYSTDTVSIKAGVVVLRDPAGTIIPSNAPHVWSVLDGDRAVKPADWRFDSGSGNGVFSQDAATIYPGTPGDPINKTYAPYWMVDLRSETSDSLARYDVLLLSVNGVISISSEGREKLRRFVDKGGLLWVDFVGGGADVDVMNNFPVPVTRTLGNGFLNLNQFHPLTLGPNRISLADAYALTDGASTVTASPVNFGATPAATIARGVELDSFNLETVIGSNGNTVVGFAQIGDGFVLLTTRGTSAILNGNRVGAPNTGVISNRGRRDAAYFASAKLVLNALEARSRFASAQSGARGSSATAVTVSMPAIRRLQAPAFAGSKGTPILANGRLITSVGGTLFVYDANTDTDLDRDGNDDDGFVDPVGTAYDRVWSSASLGTISEPTYVEVPGSPIAEQVWVQSLDGRLHGFNLNQTVGTGVTPFASITPPAGGPGVQPKVFAPTYHEGVLYVADAGTLNEGRLWMVNPKMAAEGAGDESRNIDDDGNTLGNYFWSGAGAGTYRLPGASPSVAYIPIQDSSGGLDLVAYIGTDRQSSTNTPAGLTSVYLGARGEVPSNVNLAGAAINLTTRAAQNALRLSTVTGDRSPRGLKVQFLNAAGIPFDQGFVNTNFTGVVLQPTNGVIQLQLSAAGSASGIDWENDINYRIDYMIDWTNGVNPMAAQVRGNIFVQDSSVPQLDLRSAPAVAASGNVGLIVGSATGGSFYNFLEFGRGEFLVKSRFEFHSRINNLGALGSSAGYPAAFADEDDLVRLIPFLDREMINFNPQGLATAGDAFYVAVNSTKSFGGFGVPTGVVLSLEASPDDPEFIAEVGSGQNQGLLLKQPDMARSGYVANPGLFSTLGSNAFAIEPIPNSTRSRVRLRTLASATRGPLNSCLSNNLPVIVSRDGQTDTIYEPEAPLASGGFFPGAAAGRWSHVNFYTVANGYRIDQGPVVAGERMVIAGASALPSLILNGFSGIPTFDGLLIGADRRISPDDTHLVSTSARPWVSQLYNVRVNGPVTVNDFSNVTPAKSIRWPQLKGVTSGEDFRIRLLQAALLGEPQIFGLAVGEGAIAVTSDVNTTVFERSDFLIADAGRIGRFDPVGNPLWALENTGEVNANQPSVAERPRRMSSPNRVYPDGNNGYVFADPGNNLVARIDASGRELRAVQRLRFHPDRAINGLPQNSSNQLRNPQDIQFWTTFVSAADVNTFFPSESGYRTITDERWDNWLIADAGNNRVVQVIDRYTLDAQGRVTGVVQYQGGLESEAGLTPAQSIVWWHSPEEFSGKRYAYNTISRATVDVGGTPRTAYAMGFNNVQPSAKTFGLDTNPGARTDNPSGFGGVVIYDGPQTKVINEFTVPALPANVLMSVSAGSYSFLSQPRAERTLNVSGLTSVSVRYIDLGAGPVLTAMLSTDRGVFEVVENTTLNRWELRWMLPIEVYEFMRRPIGSAGPFVIGQLGQNPEGFRPMHARRLESGDVLVVNGYAGTKKNNEPFAGEVVVIDGSIGAVADPRQPSYSVTRANLGFNALSILFELPPVQGIRGISRPVFAERQ